MVIILFRVYKFVYHLEYLLRDGYFASSRFNPHRLTPPRKGDGAGMGQYFVPAPWGEARRGGDGFSIFIPNPSRPVPTLH